MCSPNKLHPRPASSKYVSRVPRRLRPRPASSQRVPQAGCARLRPRPANLKCVCSPNKLRPRLASSKCVSRVLSRLRPTHAFAAFLGGGGQSHGYGSIHRRSDGVGRSAPYHPTGSSHVSTEASSMLALPAVHATGRDVTPMDGTKLATSLAVPPSGEVPATGRPSC